MYESDVAIIIQKAEKVLLNVKGICGVVRLNKEDLDKIMKLESEAEGRTVMGMGKGFNDGLREVVKREVVLAVSNNNDFRHASEPTVYWVSAGEVIGREVTNKEEAKKLSEKPDVFFIGESFVVFRDKLKKVRGKDGHFSFPGLPFPELEVLREVKEVISASPSGLVDVHIRQNAGWNLEDPKLGTIMIGFNLRKIDART